LVGQFRAKIISWTWRRPGNSGRDSYYYGIWGSKEGRPFLGGEIPGVSNQPLDRKEGGQDALRNWNLAQLGVGATNWGWGNGSPGGKI